MQKLQLTLAIIKPHIVKQPFFLEQIRRNILEHDFKVILSSRMIIPENLIKKFYLEHKDKFFYNRLVTFMTSGACDIYVLARVDAISHWRSVMGPTKVFRAQYTHPDSIRGRYGLSDTRNVSHGSDSPQNAKEEIELFFPKFSLDHWMNYEEPYYRNESIELIKDDFRHVPLSRLVKNLI